MNKGAAALLVSTATLWGCVAAPVYPQHGLREIWIEHGPSEEIFNADVERCREYAAYASPAVVMANSAIFGAAFGALLGAAIGGRSLVGYGARVGAADGLAAGFVRGLSEQAQVGAQCMGNLGYRLVPQYY